MFDFLGKKRGNEAPNSKNDDMFDDSVKEQSEQKDNKPKQEFGKESFLSLLLVLVMAIAIVAPIRLFIAKPFVVNGASMSPNFDTWDYLIVDLATYNFVREPKRGDVVIFKAPVMNGKYFIKRIIALPGESLEIKNGKTIIYNKKYPSGFELEEPYVSEDNKSFGDMDKITLGKDKYFVMGDNRKGSYDSRAWGPLSAENITGRAFLRLFPFSEEHILPAQNFK